MTDSSRSPASLVLSDLTVQIASRDLLRNVTLTVPAEKLTVIIGGSGAGKSVLLKLIAGLIQPHESAIRYTGAIRLSADEEGVPHRVGIVFQNFALFDEWAAEDNVQFAIDHRTDRLQPPARTAKAWLQELRVDPTAKPAVLSGGQKQRLSIARTLAAEPSLVLYDEPTSGLDHATGLEVAALIAETHRAHRQTSIIVTHDYDAMMGIADHCFLLDAQEASLREIPQDQWNRIAEHLRPVHLQSRAPNDVAAKWSLLWDKLLIGLGKIVHATLLVLALPFQLPSSGITAKWFVRFFAHGMRLIAGPSSWGYLAMAGAIIGFTSTYFTFRFLPFELYSKPLLIEDLLGSIGFALYRILVPVLATILVAARCGAAMAADVGVKRYGSQVDALQTLGVRPAAYLLAPTILGFLIATPLLQWIAFGAARVVSLVCFTFTHPDVGPYFWSQHFYRNLRDPDGWFFVGAHWVLLKALLCGIGIAVISYYQGIRPKASAGEVSHAITATVLWSTLYVLVVHFAIALVEF